MFRLFALAFVVVTLAACDAAGPAALDAVDTTSAGTSAAAAAINLHGPITEASGDRITVGGLVFVVNSQTRLLSRRNRTLPLSAFTVGTYVEAEGRLNADGSVRAKKLKMEDAPDGVSVDVRGSITAMTETTVTIADQTFTTTASTRYLDDRNQAIGRSAFGVGTFTELEGTQIPGGPLLADKLKMDDN